MTTIPNTCIRTRVGDLIMLGDDDVIEPGDVWNARSNGLHSSGGWLDVGINAPYALGTTAKMHPKFYVARPERMMPTTQAGEESEDAE